MIEKKLKEIIKKTANWLPEEIAIDEDSNLNTDLGFDSLSKIKLQIEIEDAFELDFDPVDTDFVVVFSTFGNIMKHIKSKI